jgi:hypothetical protein
VRPETIHLPQKSSDTKSNGQSAPMECFAKRKSGENPRYFYFSEIQNRSIARSSYQAGVPSKLYCTQHHPKAFLTCQSPYTRKS